MKAFKHVVNFIKKLLKGENVLIIRQGKESWEEQFKKGDWDRLREVQPNTEKLFLLMQQVWGSYEAPIRVLDVGCGNGGLARLIKDSNYEVAYVGGDISETALEEARKINPEGTYVAYDAEDPPENLGTYDFIVFNEVLFYIDPTQVLQAYRKFAHSNTAVCISVIRTWRSPFIWNRIRAHTQITKKATISSIKKDGKSKNVWDIALATFKE